MDRDWIAPEALPPGLGAVMTTRAGGSSAAPWDTMNLGTEVGDAADAVAANRRRLAEAAGAAPVFLRQVHGNKVAQVRAADAAPEARVIEADAAVCNEPGVACVVQVADCLPVLLAAPGLRGVAAAHAGWRGLAGGVLEATVAAMQVPPGDILAWMGAAIGPEAFEVGDDVRDAFRAQHPETAAAFVPQGAPGKWLADIYALARIRLGQVGVTAVHGGGRCTYTEADTFFSYRRDGVTGRMASVVWIA